MNRFLLYFHTLRYLKPIQIWGRFVFRFHHPKPELHPAPSLRCTDGEWVAPASRGVSMVGAERFNFLNEEHTLADNNSWSLPALSKLWLYNLHYFDDLNAVRSIERTDWHRQLIERWIDDNPPTDGIGWEPYPLSLRIINWLKWALAGNELSEKSLHSLAVQVRYLSRRLERHLLGNHLFINGKALIFAGCFFEGDEADTWLDLGMDIIGCEIAEQILEDGGHFERSTMYHALAFEDILDLFNLSRAYPRVFVPWQNMVAGWPEQICKMGLWLAAMLHTDGEISFFNDAAMGVSPVPCELFAYQRRLQIEQRMPGGNNLLTLPDSGYVRAESGDALLIADVAPVGPDYLPAHAHADTLSFELSLFGQRLFVNTGTSRYGVDAEREWERSTAAHNTVEIDGQDSSEVWDGFRVARRAYPFDVSTNVIDDVMIVVASHDGYDRLAGGNIHRRKFILRATSLIIEDEVSGSFKNAVARFYLHPEVKIVVQKLNEGLIVLQLPHGEKVDFVANGGALLLNSTTWHPRFGVSVPNLCISVGFNATSVNTEIKWQRGAV